MEELKMVLMQTEIVKEKKTSKKDGGVVETITCRRFYPIFDGNRKEGFYSELDVTQYDTIVLWDLNKNTASQISVGEYTEFKDWASAIKCINREIRFSNNPVSDDEYVYTVEGCIKWKKQNDEKLKPFVVDIFDMFTDEWVERKAYLKWDAAIDYINRNVDPNHPKFTPAGILVNRSCRIIINGIDVTDYFMKDDGCDVVPSANISKGDYIFRVIRKYNPMVSQIHHLYAIDKDQELHHLYTSSYSQNFFNHTAIRTQQSGDLKCRYDIDMATEKLDPEGEEIIPPSEDELLEHLKEGKVAQCIQEMLDRNSVTEEIAEFLTVSLFEMDNKVTMTTARYSKDGVRENSHSDRVLAGNLVSIYPQCLEIN